MSRNSHTILRVPSSDSSSYFDSSSASDNETNDNLSSPISSPDVIGEKFPRAVQKMTQLLPQSTPRIARQSEKSKRLSKLLKSARTLDNDQRNESLDSVRHQSHRSSSRDKLYTSSKRKRRDKNLLTGSPLDERPMNKAVTMAKDCMRSTFGWCKENGESLLTSPNGRRILSITIIGFAIFGFYHLMRSLLV